MPTQLGTAVNFAFGSAAGLTIGTPTLTGYLAQSLQHGLESDLATLRDGDGTTVNETFYDPRGTAELRVAISGTTIAVSRTNTTLDNFPSGTIVNITACAARPDLVESNWVVTEAGPRVEGGNTDVAMIVIPLRRRAGITAVATVS
jgi:hypothetical protein